MKKLLVLMLVLGMASLASATLIGNIDWTIVGDQLQGVGRVEATYSVMITYQDGGNAFGPANTIISPDTSADDTYGTWTEAGDLASVSTAGANWNVYAEDSGVGDMAIDVLWFSFDIDVETASQLNFWDDGNYTTAEGIMIVPEPMTMILLGLGGLFLRRKK